MGPNETLERYLLGEILGWRKELEKLDGAAVSQILDILSTGSLDIRRKLENALPRFLDSAPSKAQIGLWFSELTEPLADAVTDTGAQAWHVSAAQSIKAYNDILSFEGAAQAINTIPVTADAIKKLVGDFVFSDSLQSLVAEIFHSELAGQMVDVADKGLRAGWSYQKIINQLSRETLAQGMAVARTDCVTFCRSYVQQASVNAQLAAYEKNSAAIKGIKWTSILDNRTCGKCAALDGQTYKLGEKKPPLIAHPRCRCLWLPVVRDYRDLGIDIDNLKRAARHWLVRESGNIDAGGRKILNAGTSKANFGGWWKTLPYGEQIKSIGVSRTHYINAGELEWRQLVDRRTGKFYTLKELGLARWKPGMTGGGVAKKLPPRKLDPVEDFDDLADKLAKELSSHSKNGPIRIFFDVNDKNESYFMLTDCKGHIIVSKNTFPKSNDFKPAYDLFLAWNKIARGDKLTFNQEYAFESIWHETIHNRQINVIMRRDGKNEGKRDLLEVVTQWCARRTYPQLLKQLGSKPEHYEAILEKGYGYKGIINNFDRFIKRIGVKDKDELLKRLLHVIDTVPQDKYSSFVAQAIKELADQDILNTIPVPAELVETAISFVLENLRTSAWPFGRYERKVLTNQ